MTFQKPSTEYWNRKLEAYLHDPLDKVFHIPGHEDRSNELLEIFGEQMSNKQFWKQADWMASGLERGVIPGYSDNPQKSGAVDFSKDPTIKHPTGTEFPLPFQLPDDATPQNIIDELKNQLRNLIGMEAGGKGYSQRFKGDNYRFAVARFFYLHLVLRFKLAENEHSYLGQLWHRIPADSRFPDHSIWQHNQIVSAINSCMDFASDNTDKEFVKERRDNVGLTVFSISPVQGFIGKSRKLRDYHTSSILLSFLAFEGIKWVMENLGPDHILYPSLIDQPLVAEYLKKEWSVSDEDAVELWKQHPKSVATFPNKFLFLCPINKEKEIAEAIKHHIKREWDIIVERVEAYTLRKLSLEKTEYYHRLWKRQTTNFWEFSHATVKFVDVSDADALQLLFTEEFLKEPREIAHTIRNMAEAEFKNENKPLLYGISHSLVQSVLASEKSKKVVKREPEPGEKCQLCGEFEVLHTTEFDDASKKAKEYKEHLDMVWKQVGSKAYTADFKEGEQLCAVCMVKRLLPHAIAEKHPLFSVFHSEKSFPTTTEAAMHEAQIDMKKETAIQRLYEGKDVPGISDRDKYYAILIMDGDKMGDLINGRTVAATFGSILHPDIKAKLTGNNAFRKEIIDGWKELFDKKVRNLIPSVHASISESLGDFAIYGVAPIVKKYKGTLIYAGGDDVAAVMPLSTVLDAANEIRKYYVHSFRSIDLGGRTTEEISSNKIGKLSVGLGNGEGISISAGILMCHHKEALSQMIARAHTLLDEKAKKEVGRNGFAIELKKRSGGSRYLTGKWSDYEKLLPRVDLKTVSNSLLYRLEKFKDGVDAMIKKDEKLVVQFFKQQLKRSGGDENLAELLKEITVYEKNKEKVFEPERLIVAKYLSKGGE